VAFGDVSATCITPSGAIYAAGTTADGEHFPNAVRLQGLYNYKCVQVVCAHSAVFVLTDTGRVVAWGRCASGLLGLTARAAVYSPKVLKFVTAGLSPREVQIRYISAGLHHCAAVSDGKLTLALAFGDDVQRPWRCMPRRSYKQSGSFLHLHHLNVYFTTRSYCRHDALYLGRWSLRPLGPREYGQLLRAAAGVRAAAPQGHHGLLWTFSHSRGVLRHVVRHA
jgi:hypothetical protein